MSKYNQDIIVEALKMYKVGKSFKEIQSLLMLPEGEKGVNLLNKWRIMAGIPARKSPKQNWDNIRKEIQT